MTNGNERKFNIPHAVFAFLLTLILYVLFLVVCEITPFGDNTWLVYNMKTQYVDYYGYFRSILSGENNIFYSFSTTLGSGILGLFTYYMISPFMIVSAFFPLEMLPEAIAIIIGIKLALATFTMDLFLQAFCGKSSYLCSVAYGFCGFLVANAMNDMWLNAIIMIPIVMLMTERMLNEGRLIGYIIAVSVMLLFNYFISYMVLIFVLLWTLVRIWTTKEKNPVQALYRLGMSTVLALGVTIIFLFPAFLELKNNSMLGVKYVDDISEMLNNIHPSQVVAKLYSLSYNSVEIYWGAPMLFCGTLTIIFVVLYFFNKNISKKERLSMLLLLVMFVLSFTLDRVNLLWHVGIEHIDFPYREAILCVFLLVTISCRSLNELRRGIDAKRLLLSTIVIAVLTVCAFKWGYSTLENWKLLLNVVILVVGLAIVGVMMVNNQRMVNIIISTLLVLLMFADLGLNATYIYRSESVKEETATDFAKIVLRNKNTIEAVKEMDSTFYRMENWSTREKNDGMMFGYNGVTNYSISSLNYTRELLQKLGFDDDETYLEYGHDNTETADSLLGIKYLLTDSAHAMRMHKDYELVVDEKIQAYRNPYALSIASGVFREMSGESLDPFSLQEDMYTRLAGSLVDIFVPANVEESVTLASRPEAEYKVIAQRDGEMYFYMTDLIDNFDNMEVYIDNEFYTYYGNDSCLKVLNLGYMQAGDIMYVKIKADDEDEFGNALFMTEDTTALKAAYDQVKSRQATIEKVSSSHLRMTLDSSISVGDEISGDVGVFTTIPYEKGWTVKVAGIKVEPVEVYDSLIYIPITEALQQVEIDPSSDIEIEMIYWPIGFIIGGVFSVVTLIIMILVASLRKSEAEYFEYDDEEEESILDKMTMN